MKKNRLDVRLKKKFSRRNGGIEATIKHAGDSIERLLFNRFERLGKVRRFAIGWVFLILLLITGLVGQNIALSNYYQTVQNVPGGVYKEGVLGNFTNANPIFATSNADTTVSRLIFSGLLKVDQNGALVGDLASGYEVDSKGIVYTVKLKPGLVWQDGVPLSSADVLYTYKTIQNPDAQSPLESSWKDIVIDAPDVQTIRFTLASPLAAFAPTLTNGIVPEHILGKIAPADLRSNEFNTARPVGAGPFSWQALQVDEGANGTSEAQIALVPFDKYNGGKPKLNEFIVHAHESPEQLTRAFTSGQLTAAQGLSETPKQVVNETSVIEHNFQLRAATMVFFKTTSGVLVDKAVRNSLVQAADVPKIVEKLGYPTRLVREPLLVGQLGYDKSLVQPAFNLSAAITALDAAGWKTGPDSVRVKDGKPLQFTLTAANTPENKLVTDQLRAQWAVLGAKLQVQLQTPTDFQTALANHSYEALLYGISIGTDPDVFVYWDSSQADVRVTSRLNFSEYKNPTADAALESGRTRSDPAVRAYKYRPFLEAWRQDAPALGLYQPRMLYLTRGSVDGLQETSITSSIERFANVENWQIRQAKVTN